MKLPTDLVKREFFVNELIEKCQNTVESRKADYSNLRSYYLFGAGAEDSPAQFNKINPTIDQLISFLYAADTTRFTIHLGSTAPKSEYDKIAVLNDALNDRWADSGGDLRFLQGLEWALAYSCTHMKLIWRDGIHPYVVVPASMGVLREDIPGTDRQEAVTQEYYITKTDLYDRLYSHPRREDIVRRLVASQHAPEYIPSGVDRIIMSATEPNITGNVNLDLYGFNRMQAEVSEDTIKMTEVWVWDDADRDYRCFTIADPGIIVYDRPGREIYLRGELPFIQICPNPQNDYYWGQSEVQKLVLLQQLRNKRINQIENLLELQVKPPGMITGMTGIPDERQFAFNRPGSWLSNDMPGAKIDKLAPDLPDDLFKEISQIDAMFNEASGIGDVLQGRGEAGVRSQGHAAQLARLGSARAKKRALVIEDSLSKIATQYMKLMAQHDATHYTDEKGGKFTIDQFTSDYIVKVDAHSNSPIFMEDNRQLAFELLDKQVIDKESVLDLLDPPMKQLLKRRLKKAEETAQGGQPPNAQLKSIQGGKRG